jgi:ArsR family transcriptional regulator
MKNKEKAIKKTRSIDQINQISTSFKILSDPTRLDIICLLFDNREGLCVSEIAESVGVSQSAVSHQLSKLEARGVVRSFREGQTICYSIADNELTKSLERVMKTFRK